MQCYFPRTKTVKDCDTVTFFPTTIAFPQVKLDHLLRQAAKDVIRILTQPLSATSPSLQASDPFRNALITLADQLKRMDTIPQQKPSHVTPSPKVQPPTLLPHTSHPTASPRVSPPIIPPTSSIPISALQMHSKELKNSHFANILLHRYYLRSRTLVTQASGPCFLIRSIDETINSFSCAVLAEDVLRLMLRYMLCRQVLCSKFP